jgi:aspartate aminotransferase
MRPNRRASSLALSTTIALDTRAKALIAEGRDIINMSVGEPDFNAPEAVQTAAATAVRGGNVRYTPAEGTTSLRKVVAAHLSKTRGVEFSPAEITICHSGKHALSGAAMALIEPGDEVLLLFATPAAFRSTWRRGPTAVPISMRSRAPSRRRRAAS